MAAIGSSMLEHTHTYTSSYLPPLASLPPLSFPQGGGSNDLPPIPPPTHTPIQIEDPSENLQRVREKLEVEMLMATPWVQEQAHKVRCTPLSVPVCMRACPALPVCPPLKLSPLIEP